MNMRRTLKILFKDLHLGPRSPIFLFAIALPFLITFLIQVVFSPLFEPTPRVGIVDFGNSQVTQQFEDSEGIDTTVLDDVEILKEKVEINEFDAGFVLEKNFDEMVQSKEQPQLEIYISGESLASNRTIVFTTAIDFVRQIEETETLVEVETTMFGDELLPMSQRLIPLILFMTLFVAGVFVPAMSLVQEREDQTLGAMLVTPVRMSEIIVAKILLGIILAIIMSFITLVLNNAMGNEPVALLIALLVSITMITEIGMIFAVLSKDVKTFYTIMKSSQIFLFAPTVLYLWPDLPKWISQIFPTYWMIEPLYKVGLEGAGLNDIWFELLIALLICILLLPLLIFLSKRMEKSLSL